MTYKLIHNAEESINVFNEALKQAQNRLIMVSPWVTKKVVNQSTVQIITDLLDSGVQVDIGYGHTPELKDIILSAKCEILSEKEFFKLIENSLYKGLEDIFSLETEYEGQFKLKLIGTHEKYLICDEKFAMIGSHNFLSSTGITNSKELGIHTTDGNIIEELIEHYDNTKASLIRERTDCEHYIKDCLNEMRVAMSGNYY